MNIHEYWLQELGPLSTDLSDSDRFDDMQELPVDSPCGDDCKKAIDAGKALIAMVRMALGENSADEKRIIEITWNTVAIFWWG